MEVPASIVSEHDIPVLAIDIYNMVILALMKEVQSIMSNTRSLVLLVYKVKCDLHAVNIIKYFQLVL